MATTYFLCGSGVSEQSFRDLILSDFEVAGGCEKPWGQFEANEIAVISIKDNWVVTGNSDLVFQLGPKVCAALSQSSMAGEFYAQTTADYYEIVIYENGAEIERLYSHETPPDNPNAKIVPELFTDDLWDQSERILTIPWDEIDKATWTRMIR